MIPVGDVNPRRAFPVATLGLIVLNVLVFLYELSLPTDALDAFIGAAGVVPAYLSRQPDISALTTIFTAMFLHGGWAHLLSNMLFLWIFGDNIEDRLGVLPFLAAYLLTGAVATLAQVLVDPQSTVPIVGASGALAGIAGTYLVLFPRAQVIVVVPILFFLRVVRISSLLFFLIWFAIQALQGLASFAVMEQGGVAWFAHIGGFGAGVIVGLAIRGVAALGRDQGYDRGRKL